MANRQQLAKKMFEDVASNNTSKHRAEPPDENPYVNQYHGERAHRRYPEPGEHVHQEPDTESKIAVEEVERDRKRLGGVQTVERPDGTSMYVFFTVIVNLTARPDGTLESINVEDTRPTDAPPVNQQNESEMVDTDTGKRFGQEDERWENAIEGLLQANTRQMLPGGRGGGAFRFGPFREDMFYKLSHEELDQLRDHVQQSYSEHPDILRALLIRIGLRAAEIDAAELSPDRDARSVRSAELEREANGN